MNAIAIPQDKTENTTISFPMPCMVSPTSTEHSGTATLCNQPITFNSPFATDLEKNISPKSLHILAAPHSVAIGFPKTEAATELTKEQRRNEKKKWTWRITIIVLWIMTLGGMIWAAAGGASLPSIVFLVVSGVSAGLCCCLSALFC